VGTSVYERLAEVARGRGRKLANNTYLEVVGDGTLGVRLHSTVILKAKPDGSVWLDSGGWRTPTTKERLNRYLKQIGWRVNQENRVWYLDKGYWSDPERESHPFGDGMTIHPDGKVTGEGPDPKAQTKLKNRIRRYTTRYMEALLKGEVPPPDNGDCFFCRMREVSTHIPLGEHTKDTSHLINHMEESYYVPSLLSRATEVFPVSKAALWYLGSFWDTQASQELRETTRRTWGVGCDQLRKSLNRYMLRQFGLAA